ncbi:MAG: cytochrome-c peroxidase [Alphaproteobacteria bacterium]|nr:cytochrome-c peroxidase [Alphaproteobacteria bacterium]
MRSDLPLCALLLLAACRDPTPTPDSAADDSGAVDTVDTVDTADTASTLEAPLRELIASLERPPLPLDAPPAQDPALVALGEALFFDPLLSGNKDIACASCHHPAWALGDGLPLALGTGASGVGPERAEGARPDWLPRNSPSLFNVGDPRLTELFWDGRVRAVDGGLSSTLVETLPEGLSGPLAAQALHPLADPREMRGQPGDTDVLGEPNALALAADPEAVWAGIAARVRETPGYGPLLEAAYPAQQVDIAQLANALAAFQTERFASTDTPWDRWLRGETEALTDAERLGAQLFFGAAGCGVCHHGALLSDGAYHNVGVPQLGPGTATSAPYDAGRQEVTEDPSQRFAFRTAPLRNVALTAPYMHNGAFEDLERVVVHYATPLATAASYDPAALPEDLQATVRQSEQDIAALHATLAEDLPLHEDGSGTIGLSNVRAFLEALTDPSAARLADQVPEAVPSGLPVPGQAR